MGFLFCDTVCMSFLCQFRELVLHLHVMCASVLPARSCFCLFSFHMSWPLVAAYSFQRFPSGNIPSRHKHLALLRGLRCQASPGALGSETQSRDDVSIASFCSRSSRASFTSTNSSARCRYGLSPFPSRVCRHSVRVVEVRRLLVGKGDPPSRQERLR